MEVDARVQKWFNRFVAKHGEAAARASLQEATGYESFEDIPEDDDTLTSGGIVYRAKNVFAPKPIFNMEKDGNIVLHMMNGRTDRVIKAPAGSTVPESHRLHYYNELNKWKALAEYGKEFDVRSDFLVYDGDDAPYTDFIMDALPLGYGQWPKCSAQAKAFVSTILWAECGFRIGVILTMPQIAENETLNAFNRRIGRKCTDVVLKNESLLDLVADPQLNDQGHVIFKPFQQEAFVERVR